MVEAGGSSTKETISNRSDKTEEETEEEEAGKTKSTASNTKKTRSESESKTKTKSDKTTFEDNSSTKDSRYGRGSNPPTDFEKSLDTEKYGYTPSIFHISLPIAALSYHY